MTIDRPTAAQSGSPAAAPPNARLDRPGQRNRGKRYRKAIGPRLAKLFGVVQLLFALIAVNSAYLVGVSLLEWSTQRVYQNWFYLNMFLAHLVLGALIIVPAIAFGIAHIRNVHNRPNRRAVAVGYVLFAAALLLLATGVVLTRLEGVIVVKDPRLRRIAYWLHVAAPILVAWLFVLHRLSGRPIRWRQGARWAGVAGIFGAVMLVWQAQDPRAWNEEGPAAGEAYFFPSLSRTSSGGFIPEQVLDNDEYCAECHEDSHRTWSQSAHRFASFNNPAYLASVRETRQVTFERDGNLQAARFCAGCHDPVVFFSGKFDDPEFDDVSDPAGQAGITCTSCHAITNINSLRGNADYTIEEPIHYPFAFSKQPALRWVNRQLVKAKPEFHKRTFLKPLHLTPEYCGTCHKVHLPEELNGYKWLRGQNHYDSFVQSGVAGHAVAAFYYPDRTEDGCNGCHMPLAPSDQFGAQDFDGTGALQAHDHQFPSANTALAHLLGRAPLAEEPWAEEALEAHRKFNEGVMRVDIFGVRAGSGLDGKQFAPLRPAVPALRPGGSYILDVVVRALRMGHAFTQGTSDSNEVWVDVRVRAGDRVVGRSGGLSDSSAGHSVDPWSHFVNAYMLDRDGNRIDRRNAQDIFVPLYNHQIPPGASDTLHYRLDLPPEIVGPVDVEVRLQYRKFDTRYMRFVFGEDYVNDLPIMTLAMDRLTFPISNSVEGTEFDRQDVVPDLSTDIAAWQRWNDYGIGLLRKGGSSRGELKAAEAAFLRVEELGRPEGPVNLARLYLVQGAVRDKAILALERAGGFDPPAPAWTVAWLSGLVNKQNGFLDEAVRDLESVVEMDTQETRRRGLDFSRSIELQNELGQTVFELAKQARGDAGRAERTELLQRALETFQKVLGLDPENATAHFNLSQIYRQLGDAVRADEHRELHQVYVPDPNASDTAAANARRRDPAADHAADAIVIYDLARPGAYELEDAESGGRRRAEPFELHVAGRAARQDRRTDKPLGTAVDDDEQGGGR